LLTERQKEALEMYERMGSQKKAAEAMGIGLRSFERLIARSKDTFLDEQADQIGIDADEVGMYWAKSKAGSFLVRPQAASQQSITDSMAAALQDYTPPPMTTIEPRSVDRGLAIYPVVDVHHGMKAWKPVTGEDWHMKKSWATYTDFYTALIKRTPPTEDAWIINLGDYFHSNDSFNATPRSKNLLDVDSRYDHMIYTGTQMYKSMIDIISSNHQNVKVVTLKGNHDPDSSVALAVSMYWAFQNEKRVDVAINPSEFWYGEFGTYYLGANHGYRAKADALAATMATSNPEMWGRSKYRHFIHGHFHHEFAKKTKHGVLVECLDTLTPRDAHAADGAYWSQRSVSALLVDSSRGEVGRIKEPI